ncbi:hypothetical protein L218DRAFT_947668 [Marasmius fiardii PR-910]|nr:hypothetical protein L218DRAFT_947668 [Marasmius fiardii PR-910]
MKRLDSFKVLGIREATHRPRQTLYSDWGLVKVSPYWKRELRERRLNPNSATCISSYNLPAQFDLEGVALTVIIVTYASGIAANHSPSLLPERIPCCPIYNQDCDGERIGPYWECFQCSHPSRKETSRAVELVNGWRDDFRSNIWLRRFMVGAGTSGVHGYPARGDDYSYHSRIENQTLRSLALHENRTTTNQHYAFTIFNILMFPPNLLDMLLPPAACSPSASFTVYSFRIVAILYQEHSLPLEDPRGFGPFVGVSFSPGDRRRMSWMPNGEFMFVPFMSAFG